MASGPQKLVIEGIVTTLGQDRSVHVAPMGPVLHGNTMDGFLLRPFRTSQTYQNLKGSGEGVFHVTDDVLLIARAAIGQFDTVPATVPAQILSCPRLAQTCRWYEFRAECFDESQQRSSINCRVVYEGRCRDFLGFNRAKHAVIEAAILATRIHLLDHTQVQSELERLRPLVAKTGSHAEHQAFELLSAYVAAARRPN